MAKLSPPQRVVLLGGGLVNGLVAHRLSALRPEVELVMIERGEAPGGHHTWSFHETDLSPATLAWLAPFLAHRWPGQHVAFPGHARSLATPYASITSESFRAGLATLPGLDLRLGVAARPVAPDRVVCSDGATVTADAVLDGRGRTPRGALELGWQKFLGVEVRTRLPHGVELPCIMDARVEQQDGYRFVYLLPFAPNRILIEDTHYSDEPGFDAAGYEAEALAYARARGWEIAEVLRIERGALPIALGGDPALLFEQSRGVPLVGLSAGLFHPTTGYTLPDAAALAERIAAEPDLSAANLFRLTREHALSLWRRRRFFRLLNRMLFHAARGPERRRVLERFYTLPEGLVERFYADRLTLADKARILSGRPPVALWRALAALRPAPSARPRLERAP